MDAQLRELKRTLEELGKASGDVYKNAGSLLIKVDDKEAIRTDIEDSIETLDIRVKSMDRQVKTLQEKYKSLQETINNALGNAAPVNE